MQVLLEGLMFNFCVKKSLIFLIFCALINSSLSLAQNNQCQNLFIVETNQDKYSNLLLPDRNGNFEWAGFTKKAKQLLSVEAVNLKKSIRIANNAILDLSTILDSYFIAKIGKFHIINAGQHGSAKTSSAVLTHKRLPIVTVHEWTTPLSVIGGLTKEGAEKGKADYNIEDAFLNNFYGLIDEFDKANPALAASILEAMSDGKINGEKIKLRSIIINTNETPSTLLDRWGQERRERTALAFLNRASFKNYYTNWADTKVRAQISAYSEKMNRAKARARDDEQARIWLKGNEIAEIDYELLEIFALSGFMKCSESLEAGVHELAEQLKNKFVETINYSLVEKKDQPHEHPIIFTPAADFTNRLSTVLVKLIQISAFFDFLKSPLSESSNLESFLEHPIEIGLSSLWRVFRIATTTMPGKTMFNPEIGELLFAGETSDLGEIVPRDWDRLKKLQTSDIERTELDHRQLERKIFLDKLYALWAKVSSTTDRVTSIVSNSSTGNSFFHLADQDFEMNLWVANGRPVWVGHDVGMPKPKDFTNIGD